MLDDYEINVDTLAVIPINNEVSKVYEKEEEYYVRKSSNKIIDSNCRYYGSSYKGRCEGTKYLTGIKSKFPVIIEESRNMIFFPTGSSRNDKNCWISLNNILSYNKDNNGTLITFKNNKNIPIDISFYSLDNQYYRATMLKSKLNDNKNINF
jgi:competence protein ComK